MPQDPMYSENSDFLSCAGRRLASLTIVSGTAGILDEKQRQARREKDEGMGHALIANGLPAFVRTWYQQPMWQSLRAHVRSALDRDLSVNACLCLHGHVQSWFTDRLRCIAI